MSELSTYILDSSGMYTFAVVVLRTEIMLVLTLTKRMCYLMRNEHNRQWQRFAYVPENRFMSANSLPQSNVFQKIILGRQNERFVPFDPETF